jgi:hypothetical protein
MLGGRVTCWRGGRRRVLSAINKEATGLDGLYARLGPLVYVSGHKPHGSSGQSQDKVWTRASTGPLPTSGSPSSQDLANAGVFQGIRHTFLGP